MNDDVLFGAIAVGERFVTRAQLEEGLREQSGSSPPRPIGQILLSRGFITEDQLAAILDIQKINAAERKIAPESGGLFGHVAVKVGFCSSAQVHEAVHRQQELAAAGRPAMIGRLLVEAGHLSAAQFDEVLRLQEKYAVPCPVCEAYYLIEGLGRGTKFLCRTCLKVVAIPVVSSPPDRPVELLRREAGGHKTLRLSGEAAETFGPFHIEEELSRNPSAVLFRAIHHPTGRRVVLRVLNLAGRPYRYDAGRFRAQAEALLAIAHPNLARVVAAGDVDGKPYLAEEFWAGTAFGTMASNAESSWVDLVRIVEKAARGLGQAHAQGVVHGLLMPLNILVGPGGEPRISELGLGRMLAALATPRAEDCALSSSPYAAPELARGSLARADGRADVYALGAILHEALTAKPLPPSRGAGRPGPAPATRVPDDLREICARATERDPRDRYRTAGALADDLSAWLEGKPVSRRAPGWRRRPEIPLTIAGLALAGGLVLALASC